MRYWHTSLSLSIYVFWTCYTKPYIGAVRIVVLRKGIGKISESSIVLDGFARSSIWHGFQYRSLMFFVSPLSFLHGLVQSDVFDDHPETTYMKVNFEGTS